MAFSGLVPRHGRATTCTKHHPDHDGKESYLLLQAGGEHHSVHQSSTGHAFPPSTYQLHKHQELPTFIAPQMQQKKKQFELDPRPDTRWLGNGAVQNEGFGSSDVKYPISTQRVNFMREPSQPKSKKKSHVVQELFKHQKTGYKKIGGGNNVYGVVFDEQGMLAGHEVVSAGEIRQRHSSASARDMISRHELDMSGNKPRPCNNINRSWEEEVREALSRNSVCKKKQIKEVHKPTRECGSSALQRSISVREYGDDHEADAVWRPTSLVKKSNGRKDAFLEEIGAKFMEDESVGPCQFQQQRRGSPEQPRGIWRGFNVKSPSEERWEEAERQEMQRELRSQSMRYENVMAAEQQGEGGAAHEHGCRSIEHDEGWAVYTGSGYVNVRPHRSTMSSTCARAQAAAAAMPCCGSSMLGRSLSMRDTSNVGLVMECAACGTALQAGAGGRLLCVCSCCAAAHAIICNQATPPTVKKRGGGGGGAGSVLRAACRRLFTGLAPKKRSSCPATSNSSNSSHRQL